MKGKDWLVENQYRTRVVRILIPMFAALLMSCATAPNAEGEDAGILAYVCIDRTARYLLAYDPPDERRGWSHLGGGHKEGESVWQTAIREFHEESNCAYPMQMLEALALRGPSRRGHFNSFVAKVPFIASDAIAMPRNCKDVERNQWVWVDHRQLVGALQTKEAEPFLLVYDGHPTRIHLWSKSAKALRRAMSDGLLTVSDPCAY